MNLQTALITLGVLLVAGIYLFSRWQEGRGGKPDARSRRSRSTLSEPSLGRDGPSFGEPRDGARDFDADLLGASSADPEQPSPPPDWDALEQEMAQPLRAGPAPQPAPDTDEPGPDDVENARRTQFETPGPSGPVRQDDAEDTEGVTAPDGAGDGEAPSPKIGSLESGDNTPNGDGLADDGPGRDSRADPGVESGVAEAGDQAPGQDEDDIPILELRVDADDARSDEAGEDGARDEPAMTDSASGSEPVDRTPPDGDPDPGLDDDTATDESDIDMREERPSLGSFLGSLKPINKLRSTIQHRLDAVKAEREDRMHDDDDEVIAAPNGRPGQVDLLDMANSTGNGADEEPDPDAEPVPDPDPDPDDDDGGIAEAAASDGAGRDGKPTATGNATSPGGGETDLQPAPGFDKLSQIDYYVKLSGERDVSRDSVLAVYREAAAGLSKAHSVYGLRLPDKVWRDLEHEPEESRFGDLVITVQLADSSGPVSEQEMTRFSNLVVKLSESTGRGFSFMAPIEHAHRQALAIDRLRRRFDSIFVVNIKPLEDEFFDGGMIDRCASQIGLTPDDNRFYARYKPVGKQKVCLYSLANMSETGEFDIGNMRGAKLRGVTFFTRPAVNRSPGAVFSEMVDAAKAFASRVKGEPIAPGYDDLSNDDIEAIRRSIEKVAREMEGYGIVPGSEEASRLF